MTTERSIATTDAPTLPSINGEIRYLGGELKKLDLMPGEVLVLESEQDWPAEVCELLRAQVSERFPGHKVLVLCHGMRLGAVRSTAYCGG